MRTGSAPTNASMSASQPKAAILHLSRDVAEGQIVLQKAVEEKLRA
jgi:hypothetical protein